MSEANWGQTGINWGLFAPRIDMSPQGMGNAFSQQQQFQQQMQMQRERMVEERRQFDLRHNVDVGNMGLRQRELDQRTSQFDQRHAIDKAQDGRNAEKHSWDQAAERYKTDDRAYGALAQIDDIASSASTPQERAFALQRFREAGIINEDQFKRFSTEAGFRFAQAQVKRMKDAADMARRKQTSDVAKTESEAEENRAKAGLYGAQADAARQKQEDPIDALIRERVRGMSGPPAPAPQPQGRVIPQSAPVDDADPNIIPMQGAAPQAPAQPQQQMVDIPGLGQMPLDVANMMLFKAAKDKNPQLTDVLSQAIGKVPKALQDDVAKKQMESIDQIGRLTSLRQRFKPEWQTWETSIKQRGLNIADSFDTLREKIPPAERQTMAEYAAYQAEAYDNMNKYIKEMTGAAMSELEAQRLRKAMPDPQKDSPTQFATKLDNTIKLAKLTHARYASIGKNGVSQYTPIESMPDVMNRRGAELEQQFRQSNPNAAQPLVDRAVRQQLVREFGI